MTPVKGRALNNPAFHTPSLKRCTKKMRKHNIYQNKIELQRK